VLVAGEETNDSLSTWPGGGPTVVREREREREGGGMQRRRKKTHGLLVDPFSFFGFFEISVFFLFFSLPFDFLFWLILYLFFSWDIIND
jgi:hypothetical protein